MCTKDGSRKLVILAALCLAIPGAAAADPISAFSAFGGSSTFFGDNVTVKSGAVGSNGSMTLQSGTDFVTVMGAAKLTGGNNLNNQIVASGDIIFNGDVSLGSGSIAKGNIDSGGNVVIGDNVVVEGSVRAAGKVTIQSGAKVNGDVDAGADSGVAISLGNNATIVGQATRKPGTDPNVLNSGAKIGTVPGDSIVGTPDAPVGYANTVLPTSTTFLSGSDSFNKSSGSTLELGPGSFNDITLGNNSLLKLTAGSYFFDTWNFGSGTNINLDLTSGNIELFFTGLVNLGNNVIFNLTGGDASNVYAETKGGWQQDSGGKWFGTIYASGTGNGGDITFGNNSNITGALWAADDLKIFSGGTINFAPNAVSDPQDVTSVPEPASLLLLGTGLVGLARRLRKSDR